MRRAILPQLTHMTNQRGASYSTSIDTSAFCTVLYNCKLDIVTSNVTSIIEVWSASAHLFAGTWRPLVSVITSLYYAVTIIFHHWVWYCTFSLAIRVFEVRAASSPLGYFCAKFHFFHSLHCWASLWRKITSLNHSLTQLIWCSGNQSACASE